MEAAAGQGRRQISCALDLTRRPELVNEDGPGRPSNLLVSSLRAFLWRLLMETGPFRMRGGDEEEEEAK